MLKKTTFILFVCIGYSICGKAQSNTELLKKSDIYFLKNSGESVDTKDSADFIRVISPPDSADLNLFVVSDFYLNGKPKLVGKSLISNYNLRRQGTFIEYFPNGRRKSVTNYENGNVKGDEVYYYPNGKLYYVSKFDYDKRLYIVSEARDSTGKILADSGKGTWIVYDKNFKTIEGEGPIVNGLKDGGWSGTVFDSVRYVCMFKDGKGTTGISYLPSGKMCQFAQAEVEPAYPGGIAKFYQYIGQNVHYPAVAKENNIQGKVFITFFIEKNGALTNVSLLRGIGSGCDDEALRVIEASPNWIPGYMYGMPARMQYNVPISFILQTNSH